MTDCQTHYEGCWETRGHHECAIAEIKRLQQVVSDLLANKIMYQQNVTPKLD